MSMEKKSMFLDSRNYNQEGYGEFGFQVALSERPEQMIITSPGSFYFRGKNYDQSIERFPSMNNLGGVHAIPILKSNWVDTRHPFTSPHYQWRDAGWLRYPSNYSSNEYDDWCYRGMHEKGKRYERNQVRMFGCLGYALALGNFNHDDNQGMSLDGTLFGKIIEISFRIEIVVSIPKLDNYRGAVEIMNSNLDESSIRTLNGTQMGEYFGASLCVVDINNDG